MPRLGACDAEWDPEPGTPGPAGARRRRHPWRVLVAAAVVLALVGAGLVGWALAHQVSAPAPVEAGSLEPPSAPGAPPPGPRTAPGLPPSPPSHLVVPTIGVDTTVSSVGLNPDRTMQVPAPGPDYDLAAWYRFSVTPGQQGPSVIIGHIDSRENGPSVFFGLGRLAPGAPVEVTRADGRRVAYVVYAVRSAPKDAFPTSEVYGPTRDPELRLITCGGGFDSSSRDYVDNTIVFARATGAPA